MTTNEPPVVEHVGTPIPETAPYESPDSAFVQLTLNYIDYGQLERLAAKGVEQLQARYDELQAVKTPPVPFTMEDVRRSISSAHTDLRLAEALLDRITRAKA